MHRRTILTAALALAAAGCAGPAATTSGSPTASASPSAHSPWRQPVAACANSMPPPSTSRPTSTRGAYRG